MFATGHFELGEHIYIYTHIDTDIHFGASLSSETLSGPYVELQAASKTMWSLRSRVLLHQSPEDTRQPYFGA